MSKRKPMYLIGIIVGDVEKERASVMVNFKKKIICKI